MHKHNYNKQNACTHIRSLTNNNNNQSLHNTYLVTVSCLEVFTQLFHRFFSLFFLFLPL